LIGLASTELKNLIDGISVMLVPDARPLLHNGSGWRRGWKITIARVETLSAVHRLENDAPTNTLRAPALICSEVALELNNRRTVLVRESSHVETFEGMLGNQRETAVDLDGLVKHLIFLAVVGKQNDFLPIVGLGAYDVEEEAGGDVANIEFGPGR
jgi:hypothetical protein